MGTRADFYIGRGKRAKWLGSIGYDGHPDAGTGMGLLLKQLAEGCTQAAFKRAVSKRLREDDGVIPTAGWPWPWDDSHTSDHAYAFDDGRIYVAIGYPRHHWVDLERYQKCNSDEREAMYERKRPVAVYPDMTARRNMGSRGAVVGAPMFLGIEGATFEDVWSDADAPATARRRT